jgi:hypothetical protein
MPSFWDAMIFCITLCKMIQKIEACYDSRGTCNYEMRDVDL